MKTGIFVIALLASTCLPAHPADQVLSVAVASNFKDTLTVLAREFERDSGYTVRLSSASSGKHFAQISHGAPFDVFLAADDVRPQRLIEAGLAIEGSMATYALGALVLWAPKLDGQDCLEALKAGMNRIAVANPKTAPYGLAAEQVLTGLSLTELYNGRMITGENISQTMNFVDTGAADAGFVARAQWLANRNHATGCHWNVPPDLHQPIRQQMVLLKRAEHSTMARDFLTFIVSERARDIIRAQGYHFDD